MITFALHCRCDLVASKNSRTQNPEICCVQFHTETNINSQSNSLRTLPYGLGSPTLVRVCPHIYASCLSFIKTRYASLFLLKLRKWLFLTVHSSSAHVQNRFIHDPVSRPPPLRWSAVLRINLTCQVRRVKPVKNYRHASRNV